MRKEKRKDVEKMDTEKAKTVERPCFVQNQHLVFLDDLREYGITNMYEACPYIMKEYPKLTEQEASSVLSYWMKTF